jgi:tetratricopeptide (TPR) repeat protein
MPGREVFVSDLARFLGIATQEIHDPAEIEREVLRQLNQRRTLIVLDNAETLVEAVKANTEAAIELALFLCEHLPSPLVSMLITSREFLGWDGEVGLERDLEGLAPEDGARLFQQAAPQRVGDAELALAAELSLKVDGHPLSLRLLGGAFNESSISLAAFVKDCEAHLLQAENTYVGVEHRHRTLYACIDTSVHYLDDELTDLLRKLWLFHAPFLPETTVEIFDPAHNDTKDEASPVYDQLYTLWRRGLLVREEGTVREGTIPFYRVLPTIRPYIEKYLARAEERESLLAAFGAAYAQLVHNLYRELNRGGVAAFIAFQAREDIERGLSSVTGVAQGQDRQLELHALNNMALVYDATGQPKRALELFEQALPLRREVGDRAGEAATLNGLAYLLMDMRRYEEALAAFDQSLELENTVNHVAGEVAGLVGIALLLYQHLNRSQEAIAKMEQALALLKTTGLPQSAAGQTVEDLQHYLDAIRQGLTPGQESSGPATMPSDQLRTIVSNTVAVMTTMPDRRAEWREVIANALQNAQQQVTDWHIEVELFTAILAILDGEAATLPGDHPFAPALAQIQYLAAMSAQTTDEALKALLQVIQLGLFSGDLSQLGENLSGVYLQAWETIVVGVESG